MNGAGMLLKSLGIDPDAMQKTVGEFKGVFDTLSQTLIRIESKLDLVLAQQVVEQPVEPRVKLVAKE